VYPCQTIPHKLFAPWNACSLVDHIIEFSDSCAVSQLLRTLKFFAIYIFIKIGYNIIFSILLEYVNCARNFIVIFPYMHIVYFEQTQPLYYSFLSLHFQTVSTGSIILFSYMCMKYFDHIHFFPICSHSQIVLTLHSCHSLFF
jgi:hypothetical protein